MQWWLCLGLDIEGEGGYIAHTGIDMRGYSADEIPPVADMDGLLQIYDDIERIG